MEMTAENLALHAEKCLKIPTHYIWGGIGEVLTEDVLFQKAELYPDMYTKEYCKNLFTYLNQGIRGFDCSGLINHFRMGGFNKFQMQENLDWNSSMLYENARCKGEVGTLPEQRGMCLYMEGHVGIYVGKQCVIEATSNPKFGNGVVLTFLNDREWTNWFQCPLIRYE